MRRTHPNGTGFQMRVRAPSHCTIAKILIETPLAITELHLLRYTATQLDNTHFTRLSDTVPQKFTDFSKKVQKQTAFNLAHYRGPLVGISRSGGDTMSSERIKMLNSLMLEVTQHGIVINLHIYIKCFSSTPLASICATCLLFYNKNCILSIQLLSLYNHRTCTSEFLIYSALISISPPT